MTQSAAYFLQEDQIYTYDPKAMYHIFVKVPSLLIAYLSLLTLSRIKPSMKSTRSLSRKIIETVRASALSYWSPKQDFPDFHTVKDFWECWVIVSSDLGSRYRHKLIITQVISTRSSAKC